jgi:hypothetical protein
LNAPTTVTASGTTMRGKPTLRTSASRSTSDVAAAPVTSPKKKYRIIPASSTIGKCSTPSPAPTTSLKTK